MPKTESKFEELKKRMLEIDGLERAQRILHWDQTTYMPSGGAKARGRHLATLGRIAHEKRVGSSLGKLLDGLIPFEESHPYDSFEASLIRIARRDFERASRVPPGFMEELFAHQSESYQIWVEARPRNDFAAVRPVLEKTLELSRQYATFFPGVDHIADPLIETSDYGMTVNLIRPLFAELRQLLVPLAESVSTKTEPDDGFLHTRYPGKQQLAFCRMILESYGYDFKRGRLDLTHHPFETSFAIGDVRITTRVNPNRLNDALFGTMHEAGHGMYEQGIDPSFEGTPLSRGASSGMHESQSRLWENQVGRRLATWRYFYPKLQEMFPDQLGSIGIEQFYKAINKVKPSLIRVDADELTYNLHVMIRFDLELKMLEGKLAVKDLPEAWQARYEADLGLKPHDDRDGVLQDVHWFSGYIGGSFQGYTLGNILSASFFDRATRDHPEILDQIAEGQFGLLHHWLKENIYRHGRKYPADELVRRVTGKPLTVKPYVRYLNQKFGSLYKL